ncbi:MAG: hypothetical protein JWO44_989 [Bacteroidetes bacterium]|nr:hypothetical protein [Bacteroidota bacterium]
MTPEFGGKKVTSGVLFSGNKALAGYYAAPGNIPQAGQLGSDLKKFVAGLTAAINKTDDIKSLTISINQTLGIGVSKAGEDIMRAQLNIVMQNVVSELKSNGLNKDIKIQMGEVNIERTEKPAAKNGGVNIKTK